MFRNKYQHGLMSVLYSCGSAPLELWDMHVKNGYIRRVTDEEVKSLALELSGTNVTTTYIFCPRGPQKSLGIKLPFLIMIIKNMKKYFTFEITILDDKDMHRRFRMSNFQSTTRIRPFCTSMPIGLSGGWNQIQFNLEHFTRRAYGTNYIETTRLQIHANCRIRRIYFADRLYSEDELPEDFKLFLPMHRKRCVREVKKPDGVKGIDELEREEPPPFEIDDTAEEEGEEGDEGEEAEEIDEGEESIKGDEDEDEGEEEAVGDELTEGAPDEDDQGAAVMREDDEEEEEDEGDVTEGADYEDTEDERDAEHGATASATEDETDAEQAPEDDEQEA